MTLKTLAGERDRIHVNYSVFDDQNNVNNKFINKKINRDKKRSKSITARTTEINGEEEEFTNPTMGVLEGEEIAAADLHSKTNKESKGRENTKHNTHQPQKHENSSNQQKQNHQNQHQHQHPNQNQNQNQHLKNQKKKEEHISNQSQKNLSSENKIKKNLKTSKHNVDSEDEDSKYNLI